MKLLHIDTSILSEQSVSRELTAAITQQYISIYPDVDVVYHDLSQKPLEHLTSSEFLALQGVEPNSDHSKEMVAINERYLTEFLNADIIVIGAPMYNFSFPSQLKSWLDRISVAGKTFKYTENGPEGLAGGKKVIIASTRGGIYSEGSTFATLDFQETYLTGFFNFIGIDNVTFIRAEGVAYGNEAKKIAVANAHRQIELIQ